MMDNPKILHRIYFEDRPPFRDPFDRFEETWRNELPDYTIMKWNASNVDLRANEWMRRADKDNAPVYFSEFVRWDVLRRYGGMYLDADCEVLNGKILHELIEELFASDEYDAFIGVEEFANGRPTAQTVAAKPDSDLVLFMCHMYEQHLSGPLWHWREERSLIGPDLMSLYFREHGHVKNRGFLCGLTEPTIISRVKVYSQDYFSPKFSSQGKTLNLSKNTCVYHLFSNLNIASVDPEFQEHRKNPLLFSEYTSYLSKLKPEPRTYISLKRATLKQALSELGLVRRNGRLHVGRFLRYAVFHPCRLISLLNTPI